MRESNLTTDMVTCDALTRGEIVFIKQHVGSTYMFKVVEWIFAIEFRDPGNIVVQFTDNQAWKFFRVLIFLFSRPILEFR